MLKIEPNTISKINFRNKVTMATKPQRARLKRCDRREPNTSTPAATVKTHQRSAQK